MAGGFFGGGDGSAGLPYLVEDDLDLNAVRNGLSLHYRQTAEIDLITNYSGGWTPISTFTGQYNGDNYKIKNLTSVNGGLFGNVTRSKLASTLLNIILENVDVSNNSDNCGGLCNLFSSNNITDNQILNCHVSGKVTSANRYVGGLVGQYSATSTSHIAINFCSVDVEMDTNVTRVGGICGYFVVNATGSAPVVLQNCRANVTLKGSSNCGGIVGEAGLFSTSVNARLTISKCITSGTISGTSNCGGILGISSNSQTNSFVIIIYCVALLTSITRISGTELTFGRILNIATTRVTLTGNRALDSMEFIS